jgi:hypothetical protein
MTITPIHDEPGRFWVTSDTDGELWLVDLAPGHDMPRCACAIEHNRTRRNWNCRHVRAVINKEQNYGHHPKTTRANT